MQMMHVVNSLKARTLGSLADPLGMLLPAHPKTFWNGDELSLPKFANAHQKTTIEAPMRTSTAALEVLGACP